MQEVFKMKFILLAAVLCSLGEVKAECENDVQIICYWGSWSIYREDVGLFNTENINTDICTTIVYAFVGLNLDLELTSMDTNADLGNKGGFANLTGLKETNPCLKTVLAIGGWNEGSQKYSIMASTDESRKYFAQTVLRFLAYYKFDGIDIDWEYPTQRGGIPDDGTNFAALLKEIKNTISPWGFSLSIAVSIDDSLIGVAYNIAEIAGSVDNVNLMAYDYVSSNSPVTGLSSPLSEIKSSVSKWLDGGLPANKLVLGIPAYAKNFVLEDPNQNGIGAPVANIGLPGIWTKEEGLLAYYEILFILSKNSDHHITTVDDTNYGYDDTEWYTYDDEITVTTKVKYAMEQKLGGIMLWALELDDFSGSFGNKYPLLNAIKNSINEYKANNTK